MNDESGLSEMNDDWADGGRARAQASPLPPTRPSRPRSSVPAPAVPRAASPFSFVPAALEAAVHSVREQMPDGATVVALRGPAAVSLVRDEDVRQLCAMLLRETAAAIPPAHQRPEIHACSYVDGDSVVIEVRVPFLPRDNALRLVHRALVADECAAPRASRELARTLGVRLELDPEPCLRAYLPLAASR